MKRTARLCAVRPVTMMSGSTVHDKITGVYRVGSEIWVTSQVGKKGDAGITVITDISDSVLVDFDDAGISIKARLQPPD